MTSRIPVRPETLDRVRDFTKGLDATTYDDAINLLLDLIAQKGEEDLLVGYRLRAEYQKRKPSEG